MWTPDYETPKNIMFQSYVPLFQWYLTPKKHGNDHRPSPPHHVFQASRRKASSSDSKRPTRVAKVSIWHPIGELVHVGKNLVTGDMLVYLQDGAPQL